MGSIDSTADCGGDDDALAAEGYRLLSEDTGRFAEDTLAIAAETWPEWDEEPEEDAEQPGAA